MQRGQRGFPKTLKIKGWGRSVSVHPRWRTLLIPHEHTFFLATVEYSVLRLLAHYYNRNRNIFAIEIVAKSNQI